MAAETELAPVVNDLSAYIHAGRVSSSKEAIEDAVDAERLGLRRVWLSERYDLKEAGALLGGMGARTTRLGLGTSAWIPSSRPPILTAAFGATMQSAYGPRLTLGLGRSQNDYLRSANLRAISFHELLDYADIFKRLWRGEVVDYEGPIGSISGLQMKDTYDGPAPEIYSVNLGGPQASKVAASPVFDGVYLTPYLTLEAVNNTVTWLREECERIGRDFSTLRVVHPMITVPEASEETERDQMHARMVTYLCDPVATKAYGISNGWDTKKVSDQILDVVNRDPLRANRESRRSDLLDVVNLVPDEWMYETSLTGSLEDCIKKMQAYRDLGVDEISTYGTRPADNARLIDAWRKATQPAEMQLTA